MNKVKKHQKIRARSTFASKPRKARFIRSLRCDQLEERNLLTAIYTDVIDDEEDDLRATVYDHDFNVVDRKVLGAPRGLKMRAQG